MFDINLKTWMMGTGGIIGVDDISNYADIIGKFEAGVPCNAEVIYNGESYFAQVQLTEDETMIMVAFAEEIPGFPPGVCITAFCDCDCEAEELPKCYPDQVNLTLNTRFAVLDQDGCPVGNVSLEDLIDFIKDHLDLDIPETICDLMPNNEIPAGSLLGPDRILVVDTDNCSVKSVSQSDIVCE